MGDRSYDVYIMSSLSRTLYTGVTNDLERRVFEHKQAQRGSFTARYNVNRLVYFEQFGETDQAITREKEIKRMTRRRKIKLIESMNPGWRDLSSEQGEPVAESGISRAAATRGNDNQGKPA
jgi:putative endonuclease